MPKTPSYRQAIAALKAADPILGALIDRVGPCTLAKHSFECLFDRVFRNPKSLTNVGIRLAGCNYPVELLSG